MDKQRGRLSISPDPRTGLVSITRTDPDGHLVIVRVLSAAETRRLVETLAAAASDAETTGGRVNFDDILTGDE